MGNGSRHHVDAVFTGRPQIGLIKTGYHHIPEPVTEPLKAIRKMGDGIGRLNLGNGKHMGRLLGKGGSSEISEPNHTVTAFDKKHASEGAEPHLLCLIKDHPDVGAYERVYQGVGLVKQGIACIQPLRCPAGSRKYLYGCVRAEPTKPAVASPVFV